MTEKGRVIFEKTEKGAQIEIGISEIISIIQQMHTFVENETSGHHYIYDNSDNKVITIRYKE